MLFKFLALFVGIGMLFLLLAMPLIQRRIRPNAFYGFRVRKTLSNAEFWYNVNAFFGRQFYRTGLTIILCAFALAFVPAMKGETYSGILAVVCVADTFRSVLSTFRFMRTLN